MAVALVHYHLRPGGVTRVLEAQSEALDLAGIPHVILSGTPYKGSSPLPVAVVPALNYRDREDSNGARGEALLMELQRAARGALRCDPTCWHVHNPTLGKNSLFPHLISGLCRSHTPLVLHIHDFAEEGRPMNYAALRHHDRLYPLAPQIRYVVINSRAREVLVSAGMPEKQCTLLPNAVGPRGRLTERPGHKTHEDGPVVLYPVRGIRRKNLGEFCLLASLSPEHSQFALSLPPESAQWRSFYKGWVNTAAQLHLPVALGVVGSHPPRAGVGSTYEDWLGHTSHFVTTSISEGFGMAFLESLALGKPLIGRDLPMITRDFRATPAALGNLYEHLLVPASWVNETYLLHQVHHALERSYQAYGETTPKGLAEQIQAILLSPPGPEGYLDYGNLPEEIQKKILPQARNSPGEILTLVNGCSSPAVEWLAKALSDTRGPEDTSALAAHSIAQYAQGHAALYGSLADATPGDPTWLDKRNLLTQFLQPGLFHFLQT